VGTGTWCCRAQGESSCCDNAFEADVGLLVIPSQTTLTISATQTITATQTIGETKTAGATQTVATTHSIVATQTVVAPSTSATCAVATKDKSGVVGGTVGGIMGAALLAALGALFWREKTRPRTSIIYQGVNQTSAKEPGTYESESRGIQELDAT